MASKFYQPGEQHAAKVSDLFATIATRYDLINDLQSFGLHRFWKHRLVKLADVKPGERALDVCCGTGDISFALAEAGSDVVGLDFSEAMLGVARRKYRKSDHRRNGSLNFIQGDAQNLPYPEQIFDIVTVGYGLRNLSNWERGLEEMWRLAKPGGRLLVLDFGKPDNPRWRSIYFSYLRWCVPIFGKIFCGDSQLYSYILASLKNYPAQNGVAEKMNKLGGRNVKIINFLGGIMSINYCEK
jgi:demethylmenaquinone methyltransferase/2-methoxy-6-polyprenyl-1,4-benzoquinol methylase